MRPILRTGLSAVIFAGLGIWIAGTAAALAQDDFERCKAIAADQARLDCLKRLLQNPSTGTPANDGRTSDDPWPLVRTRRPNGAADAVAITRTAETSQSNPDLAGLMIRCQERSKIEVLLALVRPVPPRSKRDVSVDTGSAKAVLHAEALPTGMALILPIDATTFTTGSWRYLKQLSVKIRDPEGDIGGVISLEGVGGALARLTAACP